MKDKKTKIIAIVIAVVLSVILIAVVATVLINKKKAADARKEYLKNLAETGYLWEEADGKQYMLVKVTVPDSVSATPACTIRKTSEKENLELGEKSGSGHVAWYVAVVKKGEWEVSVSCEGCDPVSRTFRVGNTDEVTYAEIGLTPVTENIIVPETSQ